MLLKYTYYGKILKQRADIWYSKTKSDEGSKLEFMFFSFQIGSLGPEISMHWEAHFFIYKIGTTLDIWASVSLPILKLNEGSVIWSGSVATGFSRWLSG